MLNLSRIFTNTTSSIEESAKQLTATLKTFIPYVFAGTICLGLREQTLLASTETLIAINCRALEVSIGALGFMALKSIWDGSTHAPALSNKGIVQENSVDKTRDEEISKLRQEIAHLTYELEKIRKLKR